MKIICAPDSFKESLTARQAAAAMARGIGRACPDATVDQCPIADGGEGTVDAMLAATGGQPRVSRVTDPLGDEVDAGWGILGSCAKGPTTAVIEMAAASGLALIEPQRRDPMRATTHGTGMLIRAALDGGAARIVMGIGGSATNDGGCGMAGALGVVFYDHDGGRLNRLAGGDLQRIARIDMSRLDPRIAAVQIAVACDVTNPLTGPDGAAHIYGPQKSATPPQVKLLDRNLAHLGELFSAQLCKDVQQMPGSGAAGGLGGGLVAFLGATLEPGIDLVIKTVGFSGRVADCDLCLTGEGRLDGQSLLGKACLGVAQTARQHEVDTIALVGSVGPHARRCIEAGLKAYHVIGEGLSVSESINRAGALLETAAAKLVDQL